MQKVNILIKAMRQVLMGLMVIGFASCDGLFLDKDDVEKKEVTDIKDLKAPADFDWETTQSVSIAVDAVSGLDYKSKISVYNGNPILGGELLQTGAASKDAAFESQVDVPASLTSLYLICEYPTGATEEAEVAIAEGVVLYSFSKSSSKSAALRTVSVSPDCTSGCSREISGNVNNLTIEGGETVCLTGALSGNLKFKNGGGTLKICGSAIVHNVNYNGNNLQVNIIITEGGSLQSHNINLNRSNYSITNWGVFAHSSNLSIQGKFYNYGVANINGFNVNSGGLLENYSDFNVSGHMNNNEKVYNYGSIEVTGHFNNNGQSRLDNYCQMIVNGNFAQNKVLNNYGYIYCGSAFRVNGGTTNEMYSGAMIKCDDIHINSNMNGNGETSGISVSDDTKINGSGSVTGAIDICDATGIEHNNGTIASSVTFCEAYIPTSACNPVGYGSAPVILDADNDGVVDALDEFPNDEYRAFTSYFVSGNGAATIGFEDLWPSKGDYDFNDLVLGISGTQVLNGNNDVVEVFINFKIRAVGAANINGFGLQLPEITPSEVESSTGYVVTAASNLAANGTELNQSTAVFIVAENIDNVINKAEGAMFNTVPDGYVGELTTIELNIVFGELTPVDNRGISFSDLNVFLICNQNRSIEIHRADVAPTDLMKTKFRMEDDTSNPATGRYYKTANNLPWALVIMNDFEYPLEKVNILDAYPQFKDWAENGGAVNQDWYLSPVASEVW